MFPTAIVVGVPARDEHARVAQSVRSILRAAELIAPTIEIRVAVACDSCVDDTHQVVSALVAADERVSAVTGSWGSPGGSRSGAIEHGLASLSGAHDLERVWIATTDADTAVDPDWLQQHVQAWVAGDHAVAGIVTLLNDDDAVPMLVAAFHQSYALRQDSHPHVHGANLGIRADAYRAVGGFRSLVLSEDHAIWRALIAAGFRCRSSLSLRVATSARLVGRAPGGFADTLREQLVAAEPSMLEREVPA